MKNKNNFYYKGVKVNSIGIPSFIFNNKNSVKKKDRKRNFYHNTFYSELKKNSPKDLIIMYDIPSEKKKERDWVRRHLKKFEYIMIQKSVWVGPSPLPKDFINYLKEIKIGDNFKIFKLAKQYEPNKNKIN